MSLMRKLVDGEKACRWSQSVSKARENKSMARKLVEGEKACR